jgi:hypothetical protein
MLEVSFLKKHGFLIEEIYNMTPLEKNNYINYIYSQTEKNTNT